MVAKPRYQTPTLVFLLTTTRSVLSADDYGGDVPCWDKFCESADGSRIACDTRLSKCMLGDDGLAKCRDRFGPKEPSPALLCPQTFLQNCQCDHGGKNDWGARCDCKLSQDATTTFVALAIVFTAVLILGFVIARWYMNKRQELILSMIEKKNELEQNEKEKGDSGENSNPKNMTARQWPGPNQFRNNSAGNVGGPTRPGGRTSKWNGLQVAPGGHCKWSTGAPPPRPVKENNSPRTSSNSGVRMKPRDKALSVSTESLLRAPSPSPNAGYRRKKLILEQADTLQDKTESELEHSEVFSPQPTMESAGEKTEEQSNAVSPNSGSLPASEEQAVPLPSSGYRRKKRQNGDKVTGSTSSSNILKKAEDKTDISGSSNKQSDT